MSDYIVETIQTEHNTRIEIMPDEFNESPREWDNLGTMLCWHGRYNLGDDEKTKKYSPEDITNFDAPDDFQEWLKENPAFVLPLYLYDHSGISMSTVCSYPYNDRWDAGQVGWIYVTKEKVRNEYGWKNVTAARAKKIYQYLKVEVEIYDQHLTGDVYGYRVICNVCEEEIDSCWGFYGDNWKENGLLESAQTECKNCKETEENLQLAFDSVRGE